MDRRTDHATVTSIAVGGIAFSDAAAMKKVASPLKPGNVYSNQLHAIATSEER